MNEWNLEFLRDIYRNLWFSENRFAEEKGNFHCRNFFSIKFPRKVFPIPPEKIYANLMFDLRPDTQNLPNLFKRKQS